MLIDLYKQAGKKKHVVYVFVKHSRFVWKYVLVIKVGPIEWNIINDSVDILFTSPKARRLMLKRPRDFWSQTINSYTFTGYYILIYRARKPMPREKSVKLMRKQDFGDTAHWLVLMLGFCTLHRQ